MSNWHLRWLLGDGVEVTGPLITILRSYDGLGIGDVPYAEVGLDLHAKTGDALVWLRYPQCDLAGSVEARRGQRERFHCTWVFLGQTAT